MSTSAIPATGGVLVDTEDQFDTRDQYLADQEKVQETDVLAGLRELEGAEGARWRIYRVGADDPAFNGFLDEIGTTQLSAVWIRDKFGGGKYKVRGHLAGNGRIIAHRTIEIAGDAPRKVAGVTTVPGSAPTSGQSFEEWERREDMRAEKRRKERNELLALLIPAVAPIAAALIGRQGPDMTALIAALKPPPPPDPIALLTQLKALEGGAKADPIDSALKLMDKLNDLGGGGGESSGWDLAKEVVRAVGPTLGPVIEGAINRAQPPGVPVGSPAGATAGALPLPGSVSDAGPGIVPNADQTSGNQPMFGMLKLLPWLRDQMAMALNKASNGSDPGLIAERILDDLPKGLDPEPLLEMLQRADWFQQLQRFDPRVAAFGPWFTAMRQAMMEELTAQLAVGGSRPVETPAPAMTVTPVETKTEIDKPTGAPKLGL